MTTTIRHAFIRITLGLSFGLGLALLPQTPCWAATTESDIISPSAPAFITMPNGDVYYKPNLKQLLNALVRFGAYDYKNDYLIDEYEMIHDCAVYNRFFKDEFRWKDVRLAIRKEIEAKMNGFPTMIFFDAGMRLSRYDFDKGLFRLDKKGPSEGVNTFTVDASGEGFCGEKKVKYTPLVYKIVLQHFMSLDGIPMKQDEAESLVRRLEAVGNDGRMVYARFKIRGTFAERLTFEQPEGRKAGSTPEKYGQDNMPNQTVRIDSKLDQVEFYEDDARTRLIAVMKP